MSLEDKLRRKEAVVAIIGLGYVGLPLATGFASAGFPVVGIDSDPARVEALQWGESYIGDVPSDVVQGLTGNGRLRATADYDVLLDAQVAFICVPTPFTDTKAPDVSFIETAARELGRRLHRDQLVILQSTTYPGTTEEVVLPILEKGGLKAGQDFHLAFCPERINPGDREHTVSNMPKVVGGITPRCTDMARLLLSQLSPEVFVVSSPRAAEMAKLLENSFRNVNIALVNELALLCERMGVNIWEVIAAASTKPFGYMPFYPSAGVGGHCIPVDPYYLSWKARAYDFYTKFIELAAEVNQSMPYHTVDLVRLGLNHQRKALRGAKILVLGVAFKKDIDDARNSPAERVIELLMDAGAQVMYNDPYVPVYNVGNGAFRHDQVVLQSTPLDEALASGPDGVVVVSAHSGYDWADIVARAPLVIDTCNCTRGVTSGREKIVLLGAVRPRVRGGD
ncbi:MAG: nucleotide sugar dehydrogenase [Bacteroidetes bacterium]|nr:nucleotide sugar dehydrogenase [Bacteroidota bacterium]MCL5025805.1 nucleotide sugar dehydrogenase [Chloroflexota bacterium]